MFRDQVSHGAFHAFVVVHHQVHRAVYLRVIFKNDTRNLRHAGQKTPDVHPFVIDGDRAETDDQDIDIIKGRVFEEGQILIVEAAFFQLDSLEVLDAFRSEVIPHINVFPPEQFIEAAHDSHGVVRVDVSGQIGDDGTPLFQAFQLAEAVFDLCGSHNGTLLQK